MPAAGPRRCELCGLPPQPDATTLHLDDCDHHFCCRGCAHIYELARDAGLLEEVTAPRTRQRPRGASLLLDRGETAYFTIDGMWCAGCAVSGERLVARVPGVYDVEIGFAAERGRIRFDAQRVDPADALSRLSHVGLRASLLDDADHRGAERREERMLLRVVVAWILGMQVMLLYLLRLYGLYQQGDYGGTTTRAFVALAGLFATVVLFYSGWTFLSGAWRAAVARTVTMDTLVALGTLFAWTDSVVMAVTASGPAYFDAVAMITQIVVLGRYLELAGGARARKDLRNLLALQPERARVRGADDWEEIRADLARPGERMLVRAGERVPLDAVVEEGEAAVDESLLTGEATPVQKEPGDMVFAGTVLTGDALVCRVAAQTSASRLSQITGLVERTLATKPPVQRLADRASAWFTAAILASAAATLVLRFALGAGPSEALIAAVAVLVVACPCALGLATPLVVAIVLGRTVRAGIVVRNPSALEAAPGIDRVVFDKTGTLTRGRYVVAGVETTGQLDDKELLCLAAGVEQYSEHPIGAAIRDACAAPLPRIEGFRALAGLGVTGRTPAGHIAVGSGRLVGGENGAPRLALEADLSGGSLVWVSRDSDPAGSILLRDELEPTAKEAVEWLHERGVTCVALSGDSQAATEAVAAELGLDGAEGDCAPAAKADRIGAWRAAGGKVAMLGDGVNDAPALAAADLSLTVAGGTEVAAETSDVVLLRTDLRLVPWLLGLAAVGRRTILQNLAWAFAYNVVAVPLAAAGLITPGIAALAMTASNLLVVGNSLRLTRHDR
jgi:heavy metal translocating P-type ATPase